MEHYKSDFLGLVFEINSMHMINDVLADSANAVAEDELTEENRLLNSETYLEETIMSGIKKTTLPKPTIRIGFGNNYYYGKSTINPVAEYPYDVYLVFTLDNKLLMESIYTYFNYDKVRRYVSDTTNGWMISGRSRQENRPHFYFNDRATIASFLDFLYDKVFLIEEQSGNLVTETNQNKYFQRWIK